MKKNNEVLVAEIICAHGIRGSVKVRFYTENAKNLEKLNIFFGKSKEKVELKIIKNLEKNIAICSIKIVDKLVDNRDIAEEISKSKIYVNRLDLPQITEEDTFYIVDLIGFDVRDENNISIGKITGVFDFCAGDIIEIKFNNSKEVTYPFKNEFFPKITDDFIILKMSEEEKSYYLKDQKCKIIMKIVIQKFGGTSVANIERIKNVVQFVKKELNLGNYVVVVVSAMSGVTNQLISYCRDINKIESSDSLSEYDAIVHTGETITSGLLSLALNESNIKSISLNSQQIPILTNDSFSRALIESIDSEKIITKIKQGYVPVIPGFQGVTKTGRITTLGRGGSDITGAAIAGAINAFRVDIYTDVSGVYSADPRLCDNAKIIDEMNYEQMLEISLSGSKVVHARAVEIGMRYDIPMRVISSFDNNENNKYTYISNKVTMESSRVLSVGYSKNIFGVELKSQNKQDKEEFVNKILESGIVIEHLFEDKNNNTVILVSIHEIAALKNLIGKSGLECTLCYNFGTISVVGFGLCNNPHIAKSVLKSLSLHNIEMLHMSCLSPKIHCIIRGEEIELCTKTIHDRIF